MSKRKTLPHLVKEKLEKNIRFKKLTKLLLHRKTYYKLCILRLFTFK